jgi:hypothetical protein
VTVRKKVCTGDCQRTASSNATRANAPPAQPLPLLGVGAKA